MIPITTLRKRAQFLELKEHGKRVHAGAFVLQWLDKPDQSSLSVGYTASTKAIGNAVKRNRARRRLRAMVDKLVRLNPHATRAGGGWVNIVAKAEVLTVPYETLEAHMATALGKAGITC